MILVFTKSAQYVDAVHPNDELWLNSVNLEGYVWPESHLSPTLL